MRLINGRGSAKCGTWFKFYQIYKVDAFNHGIISYSSSSISSYVITRSSSVLSDSTSVSLNVPTDVILDPIEGIYVVDRYNYRVEFFDKDLFIG